MAAHLSGIVPIYFLRTSTLMLSHDFYNPGQRLSFECTIDLSSCPKFAIWCWDPDFEGASPLFTMFQQITSVAGRRMFRVIVLKINPGPKRRLPDGTPCLTRYTFLSMMPSILTKSPVPKAQNGPTVSKRHSFLYLSPSLRRAWTLCLLPNCSNLDSSVSKTLNQPSFVHFLCSFDHKIVQITGFHSIFLFQ